jgi:predicted esterase YcpF (UPF0227 family)
LAALIYIHGFLSSPLSFKAQQVKVWLAEHYPDVAYYCPTLPPYPVETQQILEALMRDLSEQGVWVMGSSLGGYWATWLAERYNVPAILINPSVAPYKFMPAYLALELKSYHSDDVYRLNRQHVIDMKAIDVPVTRHNNYWLLVQMGDEVLDYRAAVAKYRHCKQTLEVGGDHSFVNFEQHLPSIFSWLAQAKSIG